jgi:hypothetical protein
MILGQYDFWEEATNTFADGQLPKAPHVVVNALPAGYTDVSGIVNWAKYGPELVGTATGFMDWKCLQREIRALADAIVDNDYDANWNSLDSAEQLIVCNYLLSRVPAARFASTVTNAAERMQISIGFDLNNRRARGNWQSGTGRVEIMRVFLFGKIGKDNALAVFRDAVTDGLLELYEGGVEGSEEDGIEGVNDFLLARTGTSYAATGLAARSYPVIDGSSDNMISVGNALVAIASQGLY